MESRVQSNGECRSPTTTSGPPTLLTEGGTMDKNDDDEPWIPQKLLEEDPASCGHDESVVIAQEDACDDTAHTENNHSTTSCSSVSSSSSAAAADYSTGHRSKQQQKSLDDKYFVDYSKSLGTGTHTMVRKCADRATGERFAVKTVRKSRSKELRSMKQEAKVLSRLDHPFILKIKDVCQDSKDYHLVFEMCKGGEVFYLVSHETERNKTLDEDIAAKIVYQVVQAIDYCHSNDCLHRDIKLESILLYKGRNDPFKEIRLIDFGLAVKHTADDPPLTDYVGSPYDVAPEVLDNSYDRACDIWSLGVMTYALLCGDAPFAGDSRHELFNNIRRAPLTFPHHAWGTRISELAMNFVRACKQKDPSKRPTARELLKHEWIAARSNVPAHIGIGKASRMERFKSLFRKKKKH